MIAVILNGVKVEMKKVLAWTSLNIYDMEHSEGEKV